MLASFTGFNFAARSRIEAGAVKLWWLLGGAVAIGVGMWSAHAIGLLAVERTASVQYGVPMMFLSAIIAIVLSCCALALINRPEPRSTTIAPAALFMGTAIVGMVYAGVASIRMDGTLDYAANVVAMSAFIAVVGSVVAIWLTTRAPDDVTLNGALSKLAGAITMGLVIAGTHYTAMAAVRFIPNAAISLPDLRTVSHGDLDEAVAAGSLLILVLAVVGAMLQRNVYAARHLIDQLREQALQNQRSEEQYRLLFDHNPNSMWVYDDSTLQFLAVNEAAVRGTGYAASEFLAMTRTDIASAPAWNVRL